MTARRIRFYSRRAGIIARQKFLSIFKELFRKSIHICSATIPFFLSKAHTPVIILLTLCLLFYTIAEFIRLSGKTVFLISDITEAAARKRDENKFVLGPVTLCIGIILTALLYDPLPATIGIYALAFGDGLASLAGKLFGRVQIPLTQGKTVAGCITCFTAIFISCFTACMVSQTPMYTNATLLALFTAGLGMFIEALPLKDADNIMIPVILGFTSTILISGGI